jgi:hypothetical protein
MLSVTPEGEGTVVTTDGPTTASTRDGRIDPASRERVIRYAEEFLPGLAPEPVAQGSCLYTATPDEDFLLDRAGRSSSPPRARGTGPSSRR